MRLSQLALPLVFAFLGFIASTRNAIMFFNGLTPTSGLLVYYLIVFLTVTVLQWFGLVIGGTSMNSVSQTIGEILIIFAFFIVVDFESGYVQWVVDGETGKKSENCSGVYLQSEDGACYQIFTKLTGSPTASRWLTFVVTPFVLTLIGTSLITKRVSLTLF